MTRPVPVTLTRVVEQLVHEFAGVFARETVQDCVLDSYERLQPGARITTYRRCSLTASLESACGRAG